MRAYRDNVKYLARRLELWQSDNIRELLMAGCLIQNQFENSTKSPSVTVLSKRFATLVFHNNLKGVNVAADQPSERWSDAPQRQDAE